MLIISSWQLLVALIKALLMGAFLLPPTLFV